MNNKKKFEDFLDRMQGLLDDAKKQGHIIVRVEDLENTFPELKENEDEQHRKWILEYLYDGLRKSDEQYKDQFMCAIVWLEKQGGITKLSKEEQNKFAKGVLTRCALSFIDYLDAHKYEGKMCVSNGECEDIENAFHNAMWDRLHRYYCKFIENQSRQETTDNVEPKFPHGTWVMTDKNNVVKIRTIEDSKYVLENTMKFSVDYVDKCWRKWDISDAKDGDVLVSNNNKPFIYNGNCNSFYIGSYCGISVEDKFKVSTEKCLWTENVNIHPATKEQCDLLFQKIQEAGYEWDDKNKELKKIEKKHTDKVEPKFHEGEWVVFNNDICQIVKREEGCNKLVTNFGIEKELVNERNLSTARLWTIQDAKDGDVLAVDNMPFIYNGSKNEITVGAYCGFNAKHMFSFAYNYVINQNITPATKEQRSILFKKMKETGYEWDAEKKELKKIDSFDEYEGLTDFERTLADICVGWIEKEIGWKEYIKDNANVLLRIAVEKFNSVQDTSFKQNPTWSKEGIKYKEYLDI